MKRLIVIVLIGFLAWQGYVKYQSSRVARAAPEELVTRDTARSSTDRTLEASSGQYRCDGRTHCSQMTSCAEATFFLRNCPGVKMDGDGDGIPCEQQWCR